MPERTIVVFGDMLELGDLTESLRREVGRAAAKSVNGLFVTYGPMSCEYLADEFEKNSPRCPVRRCATIGDVRTLLNAMVMPGDSVMLKASHAMHLSDAIKI